MHRTIGVDVVYSVSLHAIKTLIREGGVHGGVVLVAHLGLFRGHGPEIGLLAVAGDGNHLPVKLLVFFICSIIESRVVDFANAFLLCRSIGIIHHVGV